MFFYNIIYFIRRMIWKTGFDFHKIGGYDHLHSLIHNNYHKDFTFLQIGANDGVSYDPIYNFVKFYNLKGYCLEPIDIYYDKLVNNYKRNKNVTPIKVAIYERSGKIKLYKHIEDDNSPAWVKGMSSLLQNHHINNGIESSKMEEIMVDALTFEDFFKKYPIKNIDLLQIDAEGYDYKIMKMFPFEKYQPKIIHFEHGLPNNFMTMEQLSEIISLLISKDYRIVTKHFDVLAFKD